jgi:hypothetical protein
MRLFGWRGDKRNWVAVAATIGVLAVLSGCSLAERSQEDLLSDFGLRLPECGIEDVDSTGSREWGESAMRLHFVAPTPCAEKYLTEHGVDLAQPIKWPSGPAVVDGETLAPDRPPFSARYMKDLKLNLDASKTYKLSSNFTTEKGGGFRVLWDDRGEKTAVYLVSVHGPQ